MKENTSKLEINADFPGGNIIVEKIDGDDVFLRQDLGETPGFWFYWAFVVSGATDRRLKFHFTGGDVVGTRGPAVSTDRGATWRWIGEGGVNRHNGGAVTFNCDFPARDAQVLFAVCPLYTRADWQQFLARCPQIAVWQRRVLCRSKGGRAVEMLCAGNPEARFRVLLTCRHHACEAMASYVLEGIIEAISAADAVGDALRQYAEFVAVPFMDADGVEAGEQGKNRLPHDHNRDYSGAISQSLYSEVAALRTWVATWLLPSHANFVFDFHCPWIRGARNETIHCVGGSDGQIWQRVGEFSEIWERVQSGPVLFHACDNLAFGSEWNTAAHPIILPS